MFFSAATLITLFIVYFQVIINGNIVVAIQKQLLLIHPAFNWSIAKLFLLFHKLNISSKSLLFIENFLTSYDGIILATAVIITVLISSRAKSLGKSYKMLFFCIYTFSFYMSPSYLTWVVPFLFVKTNLKELIYLIPTTIHIYFLHIIPLIGMNFGVIIRQGGLFSAISFIFGVLTWLFCFWMFFIGFDEVYYRLEVIKKKKKRKYYKL